MVEFKCVERSYNHTLVSFTDWLNDFGREGWNLVAVDQDCFIFSREITEFKMVEDE